MRTLQQTLFPNGEQIEWGAGRSAPWAAFCTTPFFTGKRGALVIGEELRTLAAWIERYGAAFYVGGASPGDDADALRGVAERIKASIGQYGESRESEWRREVSEGETVLGFLEWLEHRIEETGDDAPDPCSEHVHVADLDCEACNAEGDVCDGARASADPS